MVPTTHKNLPPRTIAEDAADATPDRVIGSVMTFVIVALLMAGLVGFVAWENWAS